MDSEYREVYAKINLSDNSVIKCKVKEQVIYQIYFLHKNGNIVYVGVTNNLERRIKQHINKGEIDFDSYNSFVAGKKRNEALKVERLAIKILSKISEIKNKMHSIPVNKKEVING